MSRIWIGCLAAAMCGCGSMHSARSAPRETSARDAESAEQMDEDESEERSEDDARESAEPGAHEDVWRDHFDVAKASLAATGNNRWLIVQPGRVLELHRGGDVFTITILANTLTIDGVQVGVLEDRETKNGVLVEVSRNFLATDRATGDVYYFGEDVDDVRDGRIVNHATEWRSGVKGAHFGLMMPGAPKVGDKFYQELAPRIAMDRVEIVSVDETLRTPAGTFEHCLHMKETTPLERGASDKWFAPGVGMIKADAFELAKRP